MLSTVLSINRIAGAWLGGMTAILWQSTVFIAVAALIAWCLRRSSPTLRYWLWQIVAVKLLLMPFWTFTYIAPAWTPGQPVVRAMAGLADATQRSGAPPSPAQGTPSADTVAAGGETSGASPIGEALRAATWQTWLLVAWAAVVLWQVLRVAYQRRQLAALLRCGERAGPETVEMVAQLAAQVGLRRTPRIVWVHGDCPLFVCGLWRPTLVLPSRFSAALSEAEWRQVVLHELAHLKRRDLWWGWPIEIARMVYFFHPLVYWVAYRLRLERELACDQWAMVHSGHSPGDYAQTLVQVVNHSSGPAAVQAAAIAAGLTGGQATEKSPETQC